MVHYESKHLKAWCQAHVKTAAIARVLAWPEPTVIGPKSLQPMPLPWWIAEQRSLGARVVSLHGQVPVREKVPPRPPKIDRNVVAVDALKAVDAAIRKARGRGLTGVEQLQWCRRIDTELKKMGI